jgi:hypothetical protein
MKSEQCGICNFRGRICDAHCAERVFNLAALTAIGAGFAAALLGGGVVGVVFAFAFGIVLGASVATRGILVDNVKMSR